MYLGGGGRRGAFIDSHRSRSTLALIGVIEIGWHLQAFVLHLSSSSYCHCPQYPGKIFPEMTFESTRGLSGRERFVQNALMRGGKAEVTERGGREEEGEEEGEGQKGEGCGKERKEDVGDEFNQVSFDSGVRSSGRRKGVMVLNTLKRGGEEGEKREREAYCGKIKDGGCFRRQKEGTRVTGILDIERVYNTPDKVKFKKLFRHSFCKSSFKGQSWTSTRRRSFDDIVRQVRESTFYIRMQTNAFGREIEFLSTPSELVQLKGLPKGPLDLV
ncbi:hypothetical protein EV361DRAFT_873432 [Lentinula raphanica]|nr:hypothetical protein EV361DRAFT_873432 [Lentinula raphanica]